MPAAGISGSRAGLPGTGGPASGADLAKTGPAAPTEHTFGSLPNFDPDRPSRTALRDTEERRFVSDDQQGAGICRQGPRWRARGTLPPRLRRERNRRAQAAAVTTIAGSDSGRNVGRGARNGDVAAAHRA